MGYAIAGLSILGGSALVYWGFRPPPGSVPGVMVPSASDRPSESDHRPVAVVVGLSLVGLGFYLLTRDH